MEPEWGPKSGKNHPKYRKRGIPESMPKIDGAESAARPREQSTPFDSGVRFRAGGGFGGNGNTGFVPLRSKNAMHPVGCGGKIDAKSMLEKGMQK